MSPQKTVALAKKYKVVAEKMSDGRYVVGIPWLGERANVTAPSGNDKSMALRYGLRKIQMHMQPEDCREL